MGAQLSTKGLTKQGHQWAPSCRPAPSRSYLVQYCEKPVRGSRLLSLNGNTEEKRRTTGPRAVRHGCRQVKNKLPIHTERTVPFGMCIVPNGIANLVYKQNPSRTSSLSP